MNFKRLAVLSAVALTHTRRKLVVGTIVLALLGAVGSVLAAAYTIVYSQADNLWGEYTSQHNTSTAGSTYFPNGDTATVYDNFTLGSDASIVRVTWKGAYYDGPPQPLQPGGYYGYGPADHGTITGFTIKIWSDVVDSSVINHYTGLPFVDFHHPNLAAGPIYTATISGNAGETDTGIVNLETVYFGPNEIYSYGTTLATPFAATGGTRYWLSIIADSAFPPEWGWDTAGLNGYNTGPDGPWFGQDVSLSYRMECSTCPLRRNISGGDFVFSLSTTKKDCQKLLEQQEKDFNDQQKDAKKAFDDQQKDAKKAFDSTPHTKDQKKAFDDGQRVDKKAFDDGQKADKDAFQVQYRADEQRCDPRPK
jgi:hypothetical protein